MARTIDVKWLARVEGEGALTIRFDGNKPKSVELRIFEPPRFFEALLRGRDASEAPDLTARICGICPVAYQMSACRAVEAALGIAVDGPLADLRRLLYCGEWIESHALHVFLLHLPDFLGLPDALGLAQTHGDLLRAGLSIKKAGNAIVTLLGGREIHPINVRVGGFYRVPARSEFGALIPELERALDAICEALEFFGTLSFPDFERDYEFVALYSEDEYAVYDGRIRSNKGLDITVDEYDRYFEEHQVAHSTALHSLRVEPGSAAIAGGRAYVCGPLARFNLSFERLRPRAREAARQLGLEPPCRNPYRSLLVRGVEIIQALETALVLISRYVEPAIPAILIPHRAGVGHGCTEAPRGLLYHRYSLGPDGAVEAARIVPPTSQNQASIEADLFELASSLADLPIADARSGAERAVRNYDPCISCSTHFLDLKIEREAS